tara:strand:+ start:363 stop:1100 length:738 start_codon:yes stop_codon:yes gene_type:complete
MQRFFILQNFDVEGPGLFYKIAQERGFDIQIIHLYLGDNLPKVNPSDLVLILGGPMGVKDIDNIKFRWLENEVLFIKSLLKKKIGIIGVCLGAQLLSYASGGNVEVLKGGFPLSPKPELGWSEIYSESNSSKNELSLMIKKPTKVLHWHTDRILLPPNAVLLGKSNNCKEQLFKINNRAYGLQFHVESEEGMVENWIKIDRDFIISALGNKGIENILKDETIVPAETLEFRKAFINKLFDLITKK